MKRKRRTGAQRLAILEAHGFKCYLSGAIIDPVKDRWEIEHRIPLAMGGTDDDENCYPALADAHLKKTVEDLSKIAKAKRVRLKHLGAKMPKGRPMPGTRRSKFKRHLDGRVSIRGGHDV